MNLVKFNTTMNNLLSKPTFYIDEVKKTGHQSVVTYLLEQWELGLVQKSGYIMCEGVIPTIELIRNNEVVLKIFWFKLPSDIKKILVRDNLESYKYTLHTNGIVWNFYEKKKVIHSASLARLSSESINFMREFFGEI